MPRTARASVGGVCYHVINRGNARQDVFHKDEDFAAFLKLLEEASERLTMRLLAYCLLNNHFHLVLWPHHDGDLSRWMQWLMTSATGKGDIVLSVTRFARPDRLEAMI